MVPFAGEKRARALFQGRGILAEIGGRKGGDIEGLPAGPDILEAADRDGFVRLPKEPLHSPAFPAIAFGEISKLERLNISERLGGPCGKKAVTPAFGRV